MRTKTLLTVSLGLVLLVFASPLWAGWDGMVKLGGIILDEEGDRSAVQETYNIYDGFSVSRLRLSGTPGSSYLSFDLREINLDARQGDFLFRRPGLFRVTGSLDQHRQVFDPAGAVTSDRKDWNVGVRVTPSKSLTFHGEYNNLNRDGERLSHPPGTESVLGTGYDNTIQNGRIGAEIRKGRRGLAVDYRISDFSDKLNDVADRKGQVVSARIYTPSFFTDKLTHMLRGAYGKSELSNSNLDYTLSRFEYTGVLKPVTAFQFKYNFDIQRVDNESTRLKTDRIQNDFDATFYYGKGSVFAGYGYETNDDDQRLTSYHSWRAGATIRDPRYAAQLRYAGRTKKDVEKLTLLKELEASRVLGQVEVRPIADLAVSGRFNLREREFPDIGVTAEGQTYGGTASYAFRDWGRASGTYTYANDDYDDLAAGYEVRSHAVTGRLEIKKIRALLLAGGVTFFKAEEDLDIEKTIVFMEAGYTVADRYLFEVKYNVYNYDDFVLTDRYYTANAVWFNVAYNIHVE